MDLTVHEEGTYDAVIRMAIDHEHKWLYLYWEYYRRNMTDDETADALEEFVETRECIKADSAEPKAIRYYQKRGFNMVATRKNNGGRRPPHPGRRGPARYRSHH